jgi:hypothetical protein
MNNKSRILGGHDCLVLVAGDEKGILHPLSRGCSQNTTDTETDTNTDTPTLVFDFL